MRLRAENGAIWEFIIHCSDHLFSHWLKAYSQFWETAQPTDYSLICTYRLLNDLFLARAMHDFQEQCQVHGQQ